MTSYAITPNFWLHEFSCRDGTPYPEEWIAERLRPLCRALEVLRADLGAPLIIDSGYRTPAYNKFVGGVSASQHTEGRASDIRCMTVKPADVHARALALYQSGLLLIGGLGEYGTFTHMDVRPGARLARWSGTRTSN